MAHLSTHELHVEVVHRPASGNIGAKASVDQLVMTGQSFVDSEGDAPVIITTKKEGAGTRTSIYSLCVQFCCFNMASLIF